jgi:hypothetical protein
MRFLKWLLALLAICIVALLVYRGRTRVVTPTPTTTTPTPTPPSSREVSPDATIALDMTILGGFTYLHSSGLKTFDIVYLNQVNNGSCQVPKTTVTLKVLDGTITPPLPPPATNAINLDGAVVTFETPSTGSASGNGPGPLQVNDKPANPDDPDQWADLKFVPNVFQRFPNNPLDPDWQNLAVVNGRVVLSSGTLKAAKPTDPGAVKVTWDFKKRNASGSPVFSQAITNATKYSTTLHATSLTITLTRGASVKPYVVTPNNHHVQLSLSGEHDGSPDSLQAGAPVEDFCGYYEILKPPPAVADRLLPHSTTSISAPNGPTQPVPGPLCGGDYGDRRP